MWWFTLKKLVEGRHEEQFCGQRYRPACRV
jgi:hypothetical protein